MARMYNDPAAGLDRMSKRARLTAALARA